MQAPQHSTFTLPQFLASIELGDYQIPQFQRKFVWNLDEAAALIDSILKGYPIGTFILWDTTERFLSERSIGDVPLPSPKRGASVKYILDGQRRATSLFAGLKGLKVKRGSAWVDFSRLHLDDGEDWIQVVDKHLASDSISLYEMFASGWRPQGGTDAEAVAFAREMRSKLRAYRIPAIVMSEASIEEATEVFARINTRGQVLSSFDVMVAKTFNLDPPFDLAQKCKQINEELEVLHFGTFSNSVILAAATAIITGKEPSRRHQFGLGKLQLRQNWTRIAEAFKRAARFLAEEQKVPKVALLPYEALVVPLAFFFSHQSNPSAHQTRLLGDFFWRASFGDRYTSQSDTRIGQDLKRMAAIVDGRQPDYADYGTYFEPEQIEQWGEFKLSDSYIKAFLCLMAKNRPLWLSTEGHEVELDQPLLHGESKNYHHFFPLAYLRKAACTEPLANHIANIVLLSAQENQNIGAKSPRDYLQDRSKKNPALAASLSSHFIDSGQMAEWQDDYQKFFAMRCRELCKAIKAQLVE